MGVEAVGGSSKSMRGRIWARHRGLLVVGLVMLAVMGMVEFVKWLVS